MPSRTVTEYTATKEYLASSRFVVKGLTLDHEAFAAASDGTIDIQPGLALAKITASGKWGPYSAAATDGRQLLTDNVVLLHERVTNLQDGDRDVAYLVQGVAEAAKCHLEDGTAITDDVKDAMVTSQMCSVQFV